MSVDKVLVPVNFTSQSDAALHYAMKLANSMGGMVTCLYVNEAPDLITSQLLSNNLSTRIRRLAEDTLSMKANEILNGDKKSQFEIIVTSGKVHHKIVEKARDLNPSYIVMGNSDSFDPENSQLGSNTTKVMTRANIPVLTVNSTKLYEYDSILLPLDLSKPVEKKAKKAVEIAQTLGVKVNILSVLHTALTNLRSQYSNRLNEIKQFFDSEGVSCDVQLKIAKNSISGEILSQARKLKAGMIMMMTQQETKYTAHFIGSTVREIINESEFPVMSITPEVKTDLMPDSSIWANILNPINLFQMNNR